MSSKPTKFHYHAETWDWPLRHKHVDYRRYNAASPLGGEMMRVEVLQVLAPPQGIVRFRCEFGVGSGRWMGSNPAEVGQFDVEIEIPEEVAEWTTVPSVLLLSRRPRGRSLPLSLRAKLSDLTMAR